MICKIFFDFGSFLIGNNFTPLSIYTLAPYLNLHFGCKSFFQKDPLSDLLSFFPKLLSITAIFLCIFCFDINNLPISYTILRNPVTYLKHLPLYSSRFFLCTLIYSLLYFQSKYIINIISSKVNFSHISRPFRMQCRNLNPRWTDLLLRGRTL